MDHFHIRAKPKCTCGKAATHEIYNSKNAKYGDYCDRHAKAQLKRLNETYKDFDIKDMPAT